MITERRPTGGVLIVVMSLIPKRANCIVLGIGVALILRTSTLFEKIRSFSLWFAPNLCSSSIIINPSFGIFTSFDKILCVPTTTSVLPELISAIYDERASDNGFTYFHRSSPGIRANIVKRFKREKLLVLQEADKTLENLATETASNTASVKGFYGG